MIKIEDKLCKKLAEEVLMLKLAQTGQETRSKAMLNREDLNIILKLYDLNEALKSTTQRSKQIKRLSKEIDLYLPGDEQIRKWFYI